MVEKLRACWGGGGGWRERTEPPGVVSGRIPKLCVWLGGGGGGGGGGGDHEHCKSSHDYQLTGHRCWTGIISCMRVP